MKPVDPDLAQKLSESMSCGSFNCRWHWLPKTTLVDPAVIMCRACGSGFKREHVDYLLEKLKA